MSRKAIEIRSAEGKSRTSSTKAAVSAERAGQWALRKTGQTHKVGLPRTSRP